MIAKGRWEATIILFAVGVILLALLVVFVLMRVPRRELNPFPTTTEAQKTPPWLEINKPILICRVLFPRQSSEVTMRRVWKPGLLFALTSVLLFAQQESREPEHTVKAVGNQAADKLDVNTASSEELSALKGIGETYAAMIIRDRPYGAKTDLIKKKVIPAAIYGEIKDEITAKESTGTPE
jgi:hypothetical protein